MKLILFRHQNIDLLGLHHTMQLLDEYTCGRTHKSPQVLTLCNNYIPPVLHIDLDAFERQRSFASKIERPAKSSARVLTSKLHIQDGCGRTPYASTNEEVTCKRCVKKMEKLV